VAELAKEAANGEAAPAEGRQGFEVAPEVLQMARSCFDRADEAARRNNFDYAVALYMDGLRYTPDDVERGHKPLYETALRQKGSGKGKGWAAMKARITANVLQMTGKKKEAFFELERAMTAGPEKHLDLATLAQMAEGLVRGKTAVFFADKTLEAGRRSGKLSESVCVHMADILENHGLYKTAGDALQQAEALDKTNSGRHMKRIRDLAARTTLGDGVEDAESFRERVRDFQQSKESEVQKVVTAQEELVARAEKLTQELEQQPNDINLMIQIGDTYARAYKDDLANRYYRRARAASGGADYRIKVKMDDLRIRQFRLELKALGEKLRLDPGDEAAKKQRDELLQKSNQFELEVFAERAKEYPTDMGVRYELGLRQYRAGMSDEAIGSFQLATRDPKHKVLALNMLGKCFFQRKLYQESAAQFRAAENAYELTGDNLWKELRYNLALTYEALKQLEKAADCYSEIVMTDFVYRDAAKRLQETRVRLEGRGAGEGEIRMTDMEEGG
jgi:tetratricopeptide (TPR) repeat protein